MPTETLIQLPVDSTPNKNLLRGFGVAVGSNTVVVQALALSDPDGNVATVDHGSLLVASPDIVGLLTDIRERLDILIKVSERRA